jgi:hypothetical protein
VYIPKTDGRLRPLGIAALDCKLVRRTVVEVLNAIYETDFLGFSCGFRPGRGPNDALDALTVAIENTKVNWVLDTDFRDFFTSLDHTWLVKFLKHRIADESGRCCFRAVTHDRPRPLLSCRDEDLDQGVDARADARNSGLRRRCPCLGSRGDRNTRPNRGVF